MQSSKVISEPYINLINNYSNQFISTERQIAPPLAFNELFSLKRQFFIEILTLHLSKNREPPLQRVLLHLNTHSLIFIFAHSCLL